MSEDRSESRDQFDKIFEQDAERKRHRVTQQLTFKDYLRLVLQDPLIAQNAASRLLEIIHVAGTEEIPEDEKTLWFGKGDEDYRFKLFTKTLYGVDRPISQFVQFLRAGASDLSTGKQVVLLVGPTASGKSTFVGILKKSLEQISIRTVYAIDKCPMHEEPLHLLPRYLREQVELSPKDCPEYPDCIGKHIHLGVKIVGDLCPHCRYLLKEKFTNEDGVVRWNDVPIREIRFSVQGTKGIGSFEASDGKSQDVSELVGKENIAISAVKGPDHPLAFTLNGELEKGNRGLFEGRELIKADHKILWVFISAAEEREIKVQGSTLPHVSIDTVIVGHTNLTEFEKFSGDKTNEALHDRIYVIPFPYPVRIDDEVRIYRKLIEQESNFSRIGRRHIAPGSLELAATFAVLTRLVESDMDVDMLTKAKIYNGSHALTTLVGSDQKPIDVRELVREGQSDSQISGREGMFGVSSRDVLAAINTALVDQPEGGCLTPLIVIKALKEVFKHRMGYSPEEIDNFLELLLSEHNSVMAEYKSMVMELVTRAFLRAYNDLARELFRKYVSEARAYREGRRKFIRTGVRDHDELTERPKEPDIKFMRSVESQMDISESEADTFRSEILELFSSSGEFDFSAYPALARAVEKKLLADTKATLSLVLDPDRPKDEESKRRTNDLFSGLMEAGCCEHCAREFVEKAAEFLSE